MAYQKHPMFARIEATPAEAAAELLEAYRKAGCDKKKAAEKFCRWEGTFARWVRRLDEKGQRLTEKMARMKNRAMREGWHHRRNRAGGRPPLERAG